MANYSKILSTYIKAKNDNQPEMIRKIKAAFRESQVTNYEVFLSDTNKLVLIDNTKDIADGVVVKNGRVVDFRNTDDFSAVTTDAYARYIILKNVTSEKNLNEIKQLFTHKRTWIIHYVKDSDTGYFEAHTHGLNSYGHPDFRIKNDIGREDISYLLNSLAKSVQNGRRFADGTSVQNLYDNAHVLLTKADDDIFDVTIIAN